MPVPIVAPVALVICTVNVSFASKSVSPLTGTVTVFDVSPGANVTVPEPAT